MRKHLHQLSSSLLITMLLCLLATGLRAQEQEDTTPKTWEELALQPDGWTTSSTEISITSAEELAWVAKMVNESQDTGTKGEKGFEGVTITLTTDLDLAGHLWMSIGNDDINYEKAKLFKGTFDGGNYTISNMTINTDYAAGLFGFIYNATIKNVKLTNCSITKTKVKNNDFNIHTGCIAAYSTTSTIESCQVINGSIIRENSEGENIGGITGHSSGSTITNCEFEGSITASQSEYGRGEIDPIVQRISGWIGGIVGGNGTDNTTIGHITNCHATLKMDIEGGEVGGITSQNSGVIQNCTTKGEINLRSSMNISGYGGIVGYNSYQNKQTFSIKDCNSSCDINMTYSAKYKTTGYDNYRAIAGGIVGHHDSESAPIIGCTSSGTITVLLKSDKDNLGIYKSYVGGIAGYSESNIIDCTSSANIVASTTVPSSTTYAGGIIGMAYSGDNITNCIASGNISIDGYTNYCGGITGYNNTVITNCQYNTSKKADNVKVNYSVQTDGISVKGTYCCIGGIVGINYKPIKNSFSTSNITSESSGSNNIGGLVGWNRGAPNSGEVIDCYATGNVSSTGKQNIVGGIVGSNQNLVNNCYATGKMEAFRTEGNGGYVGGIVGYNYENSKVENCLALNTSGLTNYTTATGRVIGYNKGTSENNTAHTEIPGAKDYINADHGTDWDKQTYPFSPDDAWDITDHYLPKLKSINDDGSYSTTITDQPNLPLVNLNYYTITFDTPKHGTLTVTNQNNIPISTGDNVLDGTQITITANANEEDKYELEELLVNSQPFTSGGTFTVTGNITISATFKEKPKPEPEPEPEPKPEPKPEPEPSPTIYYIVTLPEVEGAVTDPSAGNYEVEAWGSFRFYLTLDEDYNLSAPVVTTDRGETLLPRESDGAYNVQYVRSDVEVFIDGIFRNPDPVANESIQANAIKAWAEGSYVHIHTPQPEAAYVYTFEGKLLHSFTRLLGHRTISLPGGNYIVVVGGKRFKVQTR